MRVTLFGVFVLAVVAMRVTRYFKLEKWQVSIGLLVLAVVLYLVNIALIQLFIKKRTPNFASNDEVVPDVQAWELTAGLGIVPKWVSWIGLLAISALITAVLPWVIELIKLLF
ncbi:MAG: hypothetical protein AB1401_04295 [Thermodesulfobacteriota bacterium]